MESDVTITSEIASEIPSGQTRTSLEDPLELQALLEDPLAGQAWVVLILNRFDKEISLTMDWHTQALVPLGTYQVEDLWSGLVVANITAGGESWEGAEYRAIMQPHQNLVFKLSPL